MENQFVQCCLQYKVLLMLNAGFLQRQFYRGAFRVVPYHRSCASFILVYVGMLLTVDFLIIANILEKISINFFLNRRSDIGECWARWNKKVIFGNGVFT